MKIKLLRDKCVSIGACEAVAPSTFALDEEGLVVLKSENADSQEQVLAAAKACPVKAIEVYDDQGQKLWPEA